MHTFKIFFSISDVLQEAIFMTQADSIVSERTNTAIGRFQKAITQMKGLNFRW